MAITLDFISGLIGWSSSTGGVATVDGVYLVENGDYYITEAGDYLATE